jgi:hypothetical protein
MIFNENPMEIHHFYLAKSHGNVVPEFARLIIPQIPRPQLCQAPNEGAELRSAEAAQFPCSFRRKIPKQPALK